MGVILVLFQCTLPANQFSYKYNVLLRFCCFVQLSVYEQQQQQQQPAEVVRLHHRAIIMSNSHSPRTVLSPCSGYLLCAARTAILKLSIQSMIRNSQLRTAAVTPVPRGASPRTTRNLSFGSKREVAALTLW